jgi:hypothetical protein
LHLYGEVELVVGLGGSHVVSKKAVPLEPKILVSHSICRSFIPSRE